MDLFPKLHKFDQLPWFRGASTFIQALREQIRLTSPQTVVAERKGIGVVTGGLPVHIPGWCSKALLLACVFITCGYRME